MGLQKIQRFCYQKPCDLGDYKPLLQVLGSKPMDDLSPRLQKLKIRLRRFDYEIVYIPGKKLTADALSRHPLKEIPNKELAEEIEAQINYIAHIPASDREIDWNFQESTRIRDYSEDYILLCQGLAWREDIVRSIGLFEMNSACKKDYWKEYG